MARHLVYGGAMRQMGRSTTSVACLAFVALLGAAFWAGVVWIGEALLRWGALAF